MPPTSTPANAHHTTSPPLPGTRVTPYTKDASGRFSRGESESSRFSDSSRLSGGGDGESEASEGALIPLTGEGRGGGDSGGSGGSNGGGSGKRGGDSFEKVRRMTMKQKFLSRADKLKRIKKYAFAVIFACKFKVCYSWTLCRPSSLAPHRPSPLAPHRPPLIPRLSQVKCRSTGELYACKTMTKKKNPLWLQEAQLLNQVDHPGVQKLKAVYHPEEGDLVHIVTELLGGPDL